LRLVREDDELKASANPTGRRHCMARRSACSQGRQKKGNFMRLITGKLARLALLGSLLQIGACSPDSEAPSGSRETPTTELRVNDPDATGSWGDQRLFLAEAIQLVSGAQSASALSAAERAQLDGEPGAGRAALIRVVLGRGAVIGASAALPVLKRLDGSTIATCSCVKRMS